MLHAFVKGFVFGCLGSVAAAGLTATLALVLPLDIAAWIATPTTYLLGMQFAASR